MAKLARRHQNIKRLQHLATTDDLLVVFDVGLDNLVRSVNDLLPVYLQGTQDALSLENCPRRVPHTIRANNERNAPITI